MISISGLLPRNSLHIPQSSSFPQGSAGHYTYFGHSFIPRFQLCRLPGHSSRLSLLICKLGFSLLGNCSFLVALSQFFPP